MSEDRRTVIVSGVGSARRIVIENGEKRLTVRGSNRCPVVYVRGGGGSSNATTLQGYNLSISDPQNGDVLSFSGPVIVNRAQVDLTDGGNF